VGNGGETCLPWIRSPDSVVLDGKKESETLFFILPGAGGWLPGAGSCRRLRWPLAASGRTFSLVVRAAAVACNDVRDECAVG
jgi:hypothetical protein